MELQPKIEPGFVSNDHKNLENMSIQELVTVLRIAYLTEDFDKVEDVLVSRDKKIQTENQYFKEKFELERLMRFQAEEEYRKREEQCERGKRAQNNYENLLKEIKKNTNLADRDIIGELTKKNNELEFEVCELRKLKKKWVDESNDLQQKFDMERKTRFQVEEDLKKIEELCKIEQNNYENLLKEVCELRNLKEKWVDDSNALAELRIKVGVLENEKNAFGLKISELEKSMKENSEVLADPRVTDFEDKDEENVGEYENDNDIVNLTPLQRYEPPSKRNKNVQGASTVVTQTGEAAVDAAHSGHGHPISSLFSECAARHVEERQENDNVHMFEEFVVADSVVVPPSDVQEQMATQKKAKRKRVATRASTSPFDNFLFLSLVHQERYSKFLANKKFVAEKNFQLEGDQFLYIKAMILARGWVELTSFAKEASKTLAKEFFANAYQGPSKEDRNDKKTRMMQVTSFVRGKKVSFHGKIINQLFGLEDYEQCSFKARIAKGSNIDHQEILSTLCRPETDWIRNKDGTPTKLRSSDLTPVAKAWATFVLHTVLPCSNVSDLTIQKAILLTAILKDEPINVGRLLAHNIWATANCSSPTSYINHASLISKLCERVKVYPKSNEEMMKPSLPITTKWIEKNSIVTSSSGASTQVAQH